MPKSNGAGTRCHRSRLCRPTRRRNMAAGSIRLAAWKSSPGRVGRHREASHETSLASVEGWFPMRVTHIAVGLFLFLLGAFASGAESPLRTPVERMRNNLVTELLHVSSIS